MDAAQTIPGSVDGSRRYRSVKDLAREGKPALGDALTIGEVEQLAAAKVPLLPVPRPVQSARCPRQR